MKYKLEDEVVDAFRAGDEEAFANIYKIFNRSIFYFIYKYCYNEDLTRDIVQNTFVAAYKGRASLRDNKAIYKWLLQIAYREMQRQIKKESRHHNQIKYLENIEEYVLESQSEISMQVVEKEAIKTVHNSIEGLSPKLRSVAILRYQYGLTVNEMAEVLSVPTGTIKSRMHRANAIITKDLNEKEFTLDIYKSVSIFSIWMADILKQIPETLLTSVDTIIEMTKRNHKTGLIGTLFYKILAILIGTASVGGVVFLMNSTAFKENESINTFEKWNHQLLKFECEIISIDYDRNFTNTSIALDIKTSNNEYDEIHINGEVGNLVHQNGEYTVSLIKDNKEIDSEMVTISNIDMEPPLLVDVVKEDNIFTIILGDDISGLDETSIVYTINGQESSQYEYSQHSNSIVFTFQTLSTNNFYIRDYAGNWRNITIKSDKI